MSCPWSRSVTYARDISLLFSNCMCYVEQIKEDGGEGGGAEV